jgi:undecaprenyl-diphosphatase
VTVTGGLLRGLPHEDAARFSFLLATPVIFAAGALKLGDNFGPRSRHPRPGTRRQYRLRIASGVCAYLAVRFPVRYCETRPSPYLRLIVWLLIVWLPAV